jgi:hypothetical protein
MIRWYAQFLMDWANGIYPCAGESISRGAATRKHLRRALSNIELRGIIDILRMCELNDVADELEAKCESGKRKIAIR